LGIKIWRFYLKCGSCMAELTFKTDPQNNDYTVEHGATRNFEPWKNEKTNQQKKDEEKKNEELDAMKKLENKSLENKKEMEQQDQLEQIKEINDRTSTISVDQLLNIHVKDKIKQQELDDEQLAASIFGNNSNSELPFVRRIDDRNHDILDFEVGNEIPNHNNFDDGYGFESEEQQLKREQRAAKQDGLIFTNSTQDELASKCISNENPISTSNSTSTSKLNSIVVKKRKTADPTKKRKKEREKVVPTSTPSIPDTSASNSLSSGLSSLCAYDSD
jgi:hypothetical protein